MLTHGNPILADQSRWSINAFRGTYVNATTLTVPGNATAQFYKGNELQILVAGNFTVHRVLSSSFSAGVTTIVVAQPALTNVVMTVRASAVGALGGKDLVNVNANLTAVPNTRYIIMANNITITLPAAAEKGDTIGFLSGTNEIEGFVVARNSLKIMALNEDLEVDVLHFFFELMYNDAANGWRFV